MAIWTENYLKSKCADITGFFETSLAYPDYYGVVTGNFDGAGLSYGFIQYNFGSGTLQPILEHLIDNHTSDIREAFDYSTDPTDYNTLYDVIKNQTLAQQVAWGDSISTVGNKRIVIEPWKTYFNNLGDYVSCQEKQRANAESGYYSPALTFFNELKNQSPVTNGSKRLYAFCFDYWVQYGGHSVPSILPDILSEISNIDTTFKTDEQIEIEKMLIASKIRASESGGATWEDAKKRKDFFAIGRDYIRSSYYDIETDWDLDMSQAFQTDSAPRQLTSNNPKIQDSRIYTTADRIENVNTKVDGQWTYNNGIILNQNVVLKSNNNTPTTGNWWKRAFRIYNPNVNFGLTTLKAELSHTGGEVKVGTMEVVLLINPVETIASKSRFTLFKTGLDTANFIAGDVMYQPYTTGYGYYFIDIWVKVGAYCQISTNILSAHSQNSNKIIVNPEIKSGLDYEETMTTAGSTYYFNGVAYTAGTAVNFGIKTITTT